jgi:hypothetical protein
VPLVLNAAGIAVVGDKMVVMEHPPTRQWSYRGPGQKPIVVLLTDEAALKRVEQIQLGLLIPLDPEPLLALVRK